MKEVCKNGVCERPTGFDDVDGKCSYYQSNSHNCRSIGNICSEMQRCTDGECIILGNIPGDTDGDSIVGIIDVTIDLRILAGVPTAPEVPTVFSSATDRTWMDRNLDAPRVAASPGDSSAFRDLYQWGRLSDGHENRSSGITGTLANGDVPGHGDFIVANSGLNDWRVTQNDSLGEHHAGQTIHVQTVSGYPQKRNGWRRGIHGFLKIPMVHSLLL